MSRPSTTNLYPPSTVHTTHAASSVINGGSSRTLTLWIHDPDGTTTLSRHDAVLNYDLFGPGVAKPGDVAEVRLIPQVASSSSGGNMSPEGYSSGGNGHISDNGVGIAASERRTATGRKGSCSGSMAGEDDRSRSELQPKEDENRRFLFVIRELEESQRKLNVQVWSFPH